MLVVAIRVSDGLHVATHAVPLKRNDPAEMRAIIPRFARRPGPKPNGGRRGLNQPLGCVVVKPSRPWPALLSVFLGLATHSR